MTPCALLHKTPAGRRIRLMKRLGLWAAVAVIILWFLALEWRASQNRPVPAFAQTAVTNLVRADLMKIARAEEAYFVQFDRFATVQELLDAGTLVMKMPGRGVYRYTAELTETGFVVTARAQGEEASRWPVLTIDERMQIHVTPAKGSR